MGDKCCGGDCLGHLSLDYCDVVSRQREFRADEGGASLAGRENMIVALERLKMNQPQVLPDQLAAFGFSGGLGGGMKKLFMTHPPLEERIERLRRSA